MTKRLSSGRGKVLFLLRNFLYLRNFEAPIRELVARGFDVVVLADTTKTDSGDVDRQKLKLEQDLGDRIVFGIAGGRSDFRRAWTEELQSGRDVVRYVEPRFASARLAKPRAIRKAKPLASFIYNRQRYGVPAINSAAQKRLERWLAAVPPDAGMVRRLTEIGPDVVVVSPMIDFHTTQSEWVRASRRLGIPSVLAVASWDNLTNKSTLHAMPDALIVWNDTQKQEAVELHGVDPARVFVTGAQLYDHWFTRRPSTSYGEFCSRLGFDATEPTLLYVGSSVAIAADEHLFVGKWLAALRKLSTDTLRRANVLVRPHPLNQEIFSGIDFSDLGPVAIHPRSGGFPVTEPAKADYFDALFHATALVGLNTSAIVEATILGRPSFTIVTPETSAGQDGTFHFHYLTERGILHRSPGFDVHFNALAETMSSGFGTETAQSFVASFLRPNGVDVEATPAFVDIVERMAYQAKPSAILNVKRSTKSRLLDAPALLVFIVERTLKAVRSLIR